jgi:hypothetical protein
MNIRPFFFFTVCCLAATPGMAEVYQSRDEYGNIIYTDVPPTEGAPEVKLPPVNVFKAPDNPPDSSQKSNTASTEEFKYQKLEIISPANDETIFINTTAISIEVKVLPGLNRAAKDRLQILWDDRVLVENQLSYKIDAADRGDHVIKAQVIDQNNKVLISAASSVHVKQPF